MFLNKISKNAKILFNLKTWKIKTSKKSHITFYLFNKTY